MAHIPDGVVSVPVLVAGAAVTVAGCGYALKRLPPERIPQVAILSAVFFVASLVHFPVGPSSVHLILNGLTGVMLGWASFPAILIALLLQAVMFGFGGVAVLGVNVMNMAVPAVISGLLFTLLHRRAAGNHRRSVVAAGFCGGLGVLLTTVAVAVSLAVSGREFIPAAKLIVFTHVPVMIIEAAFSAAAIGLLLRVKPEFIAPAGPSLAQEGVP
ncbi:MAG: cobalt transporter CbiM [Bacteroidota bacterium]